MTFRSHRYFHKTIALLIMAAILGQSAGCALLVNQQKQTIRISTTPPGRTVYIKGTTAKDGEYVTLTKAFDVAEANVGSPTRPTSTDLKFNPDVWLLGDAALLLVFVLPGLIALGVDYGTGAWRTYEDPQILLVSEGSPAKTEPAPAAVVDPPASTIKKATVKPAKKAPVPPPSPPLDTTPEPEPSPIQP